MIGAGIVKVGKDDLGFSQQLAIQERLPADDGSFTSQIRQRHFVDELVARAGHTVALLIQREDAQIYIPVDIG